MRLSPPGSPDAALRLAVPLLATAIVAAGCAGGLGVDAADASYRALAWLGDNVYAIVDKGSESDGLVRVRDGKETSVQLGDGPCGLVQRWYGLTASAGALIVTVRCSTGEPMQLLRFDPDEPHYQVIGTGGGPAPSVAFDAERGRAVIAAESVESCHSLAITDGGARLLPLHASNEPDAELRIGIGGEPKCPGDLDARLPAYTSDGTLVFLAAPTSALQPGVDRRSGTFSLYGLRSGATTTTRPVGSFTRPNDLAALPNGRTVVVSSAVPGGAFAIRTVDLQDGSTRLIRVGEFTSFAVSPDGKRLAAVAGDVRQNHKIVFIALDG